MAEITGKTFNYDKTELTVKFPQNTGTTENVYSVQVSGTAVDGVTRVLSNTATVHQNPNGAIWFSPSAYSGESAGGNAVVEIFLENVDGSTLQVTAWDGAFIVNPHVENGQILFYLRENTTAVGRGGTITVSGFDINGESIESSLEIEQAAGLPVSIKVLPEETETTFSATEVLFGIQILNGSVESGTIGLAAHSSNVTENNLTVSQDGATLAIPENQSYISQNKYTFKVSAITTSNEYVESNEVVVLQNPRTTSGTLRLTASSREISYSARTATFRVVSEGIDNIDACDGLGTISDDILTITFPANVSYTEEIFLNACVSGITSDGTVVRAYSTVKQRKCPGLFLGVSSEDAKQRMADSEPQGNPFQIEAPWYTTSALLYFLSPNLTNIGIISLSEGVTAEIFNVSGTISVTFPQNLDESVIAERILVVSGKTSDGGAITKTCKIIQGTMVGGRIILGLQGSIETTETDVDSLPHTINLEYQTTGVTNLEISSATRPIGIEISKAFSGDNGVTINIGENRSYTQNCFYEVVVKGTNGNGDEVVSNVFTIVQGQKVIPPARIFFNLEGCDGTGECESDVEDYSTGAAYSYTSENISEGSLEVFFDEGSADDATLSFDSENVYINFDGYPDEDKTYHIILKGYDLSGQNEIVCLSPLTVVHHAMSIPVLEATFEGGTSGEIGVEVVVNCDETEAILIIRGENLDFSYLPTLSGQRCSFSVGQWENRVCQCTVSYPENENYRDDTHEYDEYHITLSAVALNGAAVSYEKDIVIKQNRCKTPPSVNLTLSRINGENVPSGSTIPYDADNITWKITTSYIQSGTVEITLPESGSFIKDVEEVVNGEEELWEGEALSNLYKKEKLWKVSSSPETTHITDTGTTHIEQNSGTTTNIVSISGNGISYSAVTASVIVTAVTYDSVVVYAPGAGGEVVLEYGQGIVNPTIVTGGTIGCCTGISLDSANRKVIARFTENTGNTESSPITVKLKDGEIETNTLNIVQEEPPYIPPSLQITLDKVSTVMYSDSLIARETAVAYWKVQYTGMREGTVGADLQSSTNIVAANGTNQSVSGEFTLVTSLPGANPLRTNREITPVITGTSIYSDSVTATTSASQVGIIDIKLFSPVNVRAEGDIIYLSVATTNVEIDSVVCDDEGIQDAIAYVSGTSSTSGVGVTIYSINVPSNLSCWTDEEAISAEQYEMTVFKEGYIPSKFVIECGVDKEVNMSTPKGLRVFTVTVSGHDAAENSYIDYVVIVQRHT